jgi:hypothetical protein
VTGVAVDVVPPRGIGRGREDDERGLDHSYKSSSEIRTTCSSGASFVIQTR